MNDLDLIYNEIFESKKEEKKPSAKEKISENLRVNKKKYLKIMAVIAGTIVIGTLVIRYCKKLNAKLNVMDKQIKNQEKQIRNLDMEQTIGKSKHISMQQDIDNMKDDINENRRAIKRVTSKSNENEKNIKKINERRESDNKELEDKIDNANNILASNFNRIIEDERRYRHLGDKDKKVKRNYDRILNDVQGQVTKKIGFLKNKKKQLKEISAKIESSNLDETKKRELLKEADMISKDVNKAQNDIVNIWKRLYRIATTTGVDDSNVADAINDKVEAIYRNTRKSVATFNKKVKDNK